MTSQFNSLPVWEETATGYICSQNTDGQKAQTTSELEKAEIREYVGMRLHQSREEKTEGSQGRVQAICENTRKQRNLAKGTCRRVGYKPKWGCHAWTVTAEIKCIYEKGSLLQVV